MALEPESRPDVSDHIHALEGWLSAVEFDRVGGLRAVVDADAAALEEHVQLLKAKLAEDVEVINKGNQRIAVKKAEKDFMNSNKERRERDEMLERARGKLKVIEDEIEEIRGELTLAEEQLADKQVEQRRLETVAVGGPAAVLSQREFENDYNVVALLDRYVDKGEMDLVRSQLVPRNVGSEERGCERRMGRQLCAFVETGLDAVPVEVVDESDADGVAWQEEHLNFVEDITPVRACDQMTVQFDENFPTVASSIRKNKLVVADSVKDSGVLGAGVGASKRDLDSDDEDGGHHITGGAVSGAAARHLSPLTKKTSFALKAAFRVLKGNKNAQYLCAAVGSIEEGVGMTLVGRTMERGQLEGYVVRGISPLHLCAQLGHTEVFNHLLLECALDVHEVDAKEMSVLHHACIRGHLEVAEAIVRVHNVDVDIVDSRGFSAVTYAVIGGHLELTRLLIDAARKGSEGYGRRLKQVDYTYKASLLHWAVMSGRLHIVKYFLHECKLSIEQKTGTDGCTPVFWAAYSSSLAVCKYLVESESANIKRKDAKDQGIGHYAAASANLEKIRFFIVAGGVSILSIADIQTNKAVDVAGNAYAADYIKTIKKANGTKAKLTGGMM